MGRAYARGGRYWRQISAAYTQAGTGSTPPAELPTVSDWSTQRVGEVLGTLAEIANILAGVLSIFHMTGVNDYLLWVAAADAQDLREFVVDHLATHPAVAHAETSLIYEHKRGPGIWGSAAPA